MDEIQIKKIIKKSFSFSNIENNMNQKKVINPLINSKIKKYNSLDSNIIKIKNQKNKNLKNRLDYSIYFKTNLIPKSIFDKVNENINKIKILNNKTMDEIKQNIKIIDKEIFHKKLNNYKFNKNQFFNNSYFYCNSSININNSSSKRIDNNNVNLNKTSSNSSNKKENNSNITLSNKNILKNYQNNNLSLCSTTVGNKLNKSNEHFKLTTFSNLSSDNQNKKNIFHIKEIKFKNLQHKRNLNINENILRYHAYKLFSISPILISKTYFIKDSESQIKCIMDKIKLIIDNFEFFKTNYMDKSQFYIAFNKITNKKKAEFNLILEEICILLIKIIPLLLKHFYNVMDKLLYIECPDIRKESLFSPKDEKECLYMNFNFLNKIIVYFQGSIELYKVIQIKIGNFKYTINEFTIINIFLDLTRYNLSKLIWISNINIKKIEQDQEIINKLENRNKYKKINENILERYNRRHKIKISDGDLKLNRINNALNINKKINHYCYSPESENNKRKTDKIFYNNDVDCIKKKGLFNSYLVNSMMKYFDKNFRNKIIAQQVIERYKSMENERSDLNN